jgi:DNA polymerase III epsilon subunit family exonuclease
MLSFDLSTPWREMSLIAVDVEATGLNTKEALVIEVGMVRFERGQVADRWGTLVDPGVPIPAKVTEITGISDEMVQGKPSFRDIKWDVYGRLRDRIFVAYNTPYDWGVLESELERVGLSMPAVPTLDPLVWSRQLMPAERRHRLGAICKKLDIPLDNAHRAEHDAEAAGKVLFRLADKVPLELGALLTEQELWRTTQEEAFAARRAQRQATKQAPAPVEPEPDEPVAPEIDQAGLFT